MNSFKAHLFQRSQKIYDGGMAKYLIDTLEA